MFFFHSLASPTLPRFFFHSAFVSSRSLLCVLTMACRIAFCWYILSAQWLLKKKVKLGMFFSTFGICFNFIFFLISTLLYLASNFCFFLLLLWKNRKVLKQIVRLKAFLINKWKSVVQWVNDDVKITSSLLLSLIFVYFLFVFFSQIIYSMDIKFNHLKKPVNLRCLTSKSDWFGLSTKFKGFLFHSLFLYIISSINLYSTQTLV